MEYSKENLDGWALPREAFEWIIENLPLQFIKTID